MLPDELVALGVERVRPLLEPGFGPAGVGGAKVRGQIFELSGNRRVGPDQRPATLVGEAVVDAAPVHLGANAFDEPSLDQTVDEGGDGGR